MNDAYMTKVSNKVPVTMKDYVDEIVSINNEMQNP